AALTRVVADPAAARAMGEAGRRRAESHFAWDAIAARTREVYARVVAG
ncbi:MAG TPA: glycogen synthase, partial [Agromyces sp.]